MLAVYGVSAYRAGLAGGLYRYSKVGLPSEAEGEWNDSELASLFAQLKSRAVVVWPEPGEAGRRVATHHAALIAASGAAAVGLVTLPQAWPRTFQLGDDLPPPFTPLDIVALVNATLRDATALALPIHDAAQPKRSCAITPILAPVDGADLYARLTGFLAHALGEPQTTVDTIALWCLHAWAHDAFDVSPRLILEARDPRADHARCLRLAAWLTPAPLVVSRTIAAHLLPAIAAERPTLLLDDAGGAMLGYIDMRALIAAGSLRDGAFLGARTRKNPSGLWPCFAPMAIATAARVPPAVAVRAIVVPLSPPANGVAREALALSDPPQEVRRLRADMQRWAKDVRAALASPRPALSSAHDQAAREAWAPLAAIAQALGSEAADAAAVAMKVLSPPVRRMSSDLELLDDVRDLVGAVEEEAGVPTLDLLEKLVADPERAWATAHRGRKLTARGLADRLDRFGLRPRLMRVAENKVLRGYDGRDLKDAFARYLDAAG